MQEQNNVWFPITLSNGDAYGLLTMPERKPDQECSVCYYNSQNESEHDTDIDENMDQETLYFTHRYAQIYKKSSTHQEHPVCTHQFHTVCLYQWFEKSQKVWCPICKQGLTDKVQMPPLLKKPPAFITTYHDNKTKKTKKTCHFEINGQKHGPFEKFNQNEQLVLKCNYKNDLKHGYEIEYYPYTQKIRSKTNYDNGVKNGKHWIRTSRGHWIIKCSYLQDQFHGEFRQWYENTNVLKKGCIYNKGVLHGVLREYNKDKQLIIYSTYYNGVQWGRYLDNYNSGTPHLKCFYDKQGELHGISIEYHKNGSVKQIEHYSHGNPVGYKMKKYSNDQLASYGEYYHKKQDNVWTDYYRDGKLKMQRTYEEGDLFGKFSRYTDRGDPIEMAEYYANQLDGKHMVLYPNKKVHIMEEYSNNQLHGKRTELTKEGNIITVAHFEKGVYHGPMYDASTGVTCMYKNGQLNGKWVQQQGAQIIIEAAFLNGKLDGEYRQLNEQNTYNTVWYENGVPLND